ncbi:MAG: sensor histidine kinase [Cryomorphaceae bacterium]
MLRLLFIVSLFLAFTRLDAQGPTAFDQVKHAFDKIEGEDQQSIIELLEFAEEHRVRYPEFSKRASEKAMHLALALAHDSLTARSLLSIGKCFNGLALFDSAVTRYYDALDISERVEDHNNVVFVLSSLYYSFKQQGLDKSVRETLGSMRRHLKYPLSHLARGEVYFTLQNYHAQFGDSDSSYAFLDSAEVHWKNTDDPDLHGLLMNNRAVQQVTNGDTNKAIATLYALIGHPEIKEGKAEAFHNLYYLLDHRGEATEAYEMAHAGRLWAEQYSKQDNLIQSLFDESAALEALGRLDEALLTYQRMDEIEDSLYTEEMASALGEARTKYDLEKRENEVRSARIQRNWLIVVALMIALSLVLSTWFYFYRIAKNKEQARLEIETLQKEKEVLSLQTMLFAQEEERQRIARDLHDSIGALLSTAKLHISNIEKEVRKLTELDFLTSTEQVIDRASKEVRRVAHDMMPGVLMKLGLFEGIEDFFDRVREGNGITVNFTYDELDQRLENRSEVMIYRMIQEMVNNTIKHAEASEIKLMIKRQGEHLIIDYKDDGIGFDATLLEDPSRFGLTGLKSRINFLNGTLELTSQPKQGVHYKVAVPIEVQ